MRHVVLLSSLLWPNAWQDLEQGPPLAICSRTNVLVPMTWWDISKVVGAAGDSGSRNGKLLYIPGNREGRLGDKSTRIHSPARQPLKAPWLPKTEPPTGEPVFTHRSLWGTLHTHTDIKPLSSHAGVVPPQAQTTCFANSSANVHQDPSTLGLLYIRAQKASVYRPLHGQMLHLSGIYLEVELLNCVVTYV